MDGGTTDRRIAELLSATEAAARAARVEHAEGLTRALKRREKILAELWGFDPEGPLPPYDPVLAQERRPKIGKIKAEDLDRLRELERTMFTALEAQSRRLQRGRGEVARGEQFARDVRSLTGPGTGRRFDNRG